WMDGQPCAWPDHPGSADHGAERHRPTCAEFVEKDFRVTELLRTVVSASPAEKPGQMVRLLLAVVANNGLAVGNSRRDVRIEEEFAANVHWSVHSVGPLVPVVDVVSSQAQPPADVAPGAVVPARCHGALRERVEYVSTVGIQRDVYHPIRLIRT